MHRVLILILLSSLQVDGIPLFACDFENDTLCEMQNGVWWDLELPLYNFTIVTGENAPDKELSPNRDHTYNSSSGHFAYWHRPSIAQHTSMDGRLSTPIFELRDHMCLNFAYYVKSSRSISNRTYLSASIRGCYRTTLWVVHTDDTLGWQTAQIQLSDLTCNVTIWFDVSPDIFNAVSVALDDIVVDICPRYITTTNPVPYSHSARFATNIYLLGVLFVILLTIF
jgi:hypothetical protein